MSERAKLLKVSAMIASFLSILLLMFIITISIVDDFRIYTYFFLIIVGSSCIRLWKMYMDKKVRTVRPCTLLKL